MVTTKPTERQLYQVAVFTDGHGSYQARCCEQGCAWRGKWHRQEKLAVESAMFHGNVHAGGDVVRRWVAPKPE
jgi:hypothetical protein